MERCRKRLRSNGGVVLDALLSVAAASAPPVVVGAPVVFAQPAPDAVVEEAPSTSDGRVRCARRNGNGWQCKILFLPGLNSRGEPHRCCDKHRAQLKKAHEKFQNSPHGKLAVKRAYDKWYRTKGKETRKCYGASAKGKAIKKRYKESDDGKAAGRRYASSTKGKITARRFKCSDKGKAHRRAVCESMRHKLSQKIGKMCRDGDIESISALQATGCASAKELRAHFESTFEPWMNWSNRGMHKAGGNSGTWQTGHRLACAFYDDSNPADIKRCWNKANLFAQDADENHALSVKMPDDTTLERLRALDLLPCAWNGIVPPAAQRAQMERTVSLKVALR